MRLISYLTFNGNAEDAIIFYKGIFNGEITYLQRYKDAKIEASEAYQNKILHAALRFGSNFLYFSDAFEDSKVIKGNILSLTLEFDQEDKLNQVYEMLTQGAELTMPLQDTFWGAKFASLKDKFGISWSLNWSKDKH